MQAGPLSISLAVVHLLLFLAKPAHGAIAQQYPPCPPKRVNNSHGEDPCTVALEIQRTCAEPPQGGDPYALSKCRCYNNNGTSDLNKTCLPSQRNGDTGIPTAAESASSNIPPQISISTAPPNTTPSSSINPPSPVSGSPALTSPANATISSSTSPSPDSSILTSPPTNAPTPVANLTSHSKKSPLLGGLLGGFAFLCISAGLIFWWLVRRRASRKAPSAAYRAEYGPVPLLKH